MTKNRKKLFCLISGLGLIVLISVSTVIQATKRRNIQKKQDEVADLLGINFEDYEHSGFPDVYFYSTLEIGMTSDEVHRIVRGYEAVYRCYEEHQNELYYYFSTDEKEATRFLIFYDLEGK